MAFIKLKIPIMKVWYLIPPIPPMRVDIYYVYITYFIVEKQNRKQSWLDVDLETALIDLPEGVVLLCQPWGYSGP